MRRPPQHKTIHSALIALSMPILSFCIQIGSSLQAMAEGHDPLKFYKQVLAATPAPHCNSQDINCKFELLRRRFLDHFFFKGQVADRIYDTQKVLQQLAHKNPQNTDPIDAVLENAKNARKFADGTIQMANALRFFALELTLSRATGNNKRAQEDLQGIAEIYRAFDELDWAADRYHGNHKTPIIAGTPFVSNEPSTLTLPVHNKLDGFFLRDYTAPNFLTPSALSSKWNAQTTAFNQGIHSIYSDSCFLYAPEFHQKLLGSYPKQSIVWQKSFCEPLPQALPQADSKYLHALRTVFSSHDQMVHLLVAMRIAHQFLQPADKFEGLNLRQKNIEIAARLGQYLKENKWWITPPGKGTNFIPIKRGPSVFPNMNGISKILAQITGFPETYFHTETDIRNYLDEKSFDSSILEQAAKYNVNYDVLLKYQKEIYLDKLGNHCRKWINPFFKKLRQKCLSQVHEVGENLLQFNSLYLFADLMPANKESSYLRSKALSGYLLESNEGKNYNAQKNELDLSTFSLRDFWEIILAKPYPENLIHVVWHFNFLPHVVPPVEIKVPMPNPNFWAVLLVSILGSAAVSLGLITAIAVLPSAVLALHLIFHIFGVAEKATKFQVPIFTPVMYWNVSLFDQHNPQLQERKLKMMLDSNALFHYTLFADILKKPISYKVVNALVQLPGTNPAVGAQQGNHGPALGIAEWCDSDRWVKLTGTQYAADLSNFCNTEHFFVANGLDYMTLYMAFALWQVHAR